MTSIQRVCLAWLAMLALSCGISQRSAAAAQTCVGNDCIDDTPPVITVSPGASTVNTAALPVSVEYCEDEGVEGGTVVLTLNGADARDPLKFTSGTSANCADYVRYSPTLTLHPGANTLFARACNSAPTQRCTEKTVVYTYDPNADTAPPQAFVGPLNGNYHARTLDVSIVWKDEKGLDPARRAVTLNGQPVTSSFSYTGTATEAESRATLTLAPGSNTVIATVYDLAGHMAADTGRFVSDLPPAAAITPTGGSYPDTALAVTIEWTDDISLRQGSQVVTLNGRNVTTSFSDTTSSATALRSVGTVRLDLGNNTLAATACDSAGNCATHTASYYHYAGDRAPPSISTAPHNGEARGGGVFEAGAAYATPAYVSMDAPRAVALTYSGAQANPRVLVQVDATDYSRLPPDRMSIALYDFAGQRLRLSGGSSEIFYQAGNGTTRLAAQLDVAGLSTGAYQYLVGVRSWWGTEYRESYQPIQVLVVNERASPYGVGWGLAGLLRLHAQESGLVMTGGDGSGAFFARGPCATDGDGTVLCDFASPAGDFSVLRYDSTAARYTQRHLDGTLVVFDAAGRIVSATDRFGNGSAYLYDGGGRLQQFTDGAEQQTTLAYTAAGKITWIQDPGGRVSRFSVDAAGNLVRATDPDSVVALRAAYDSRNRLLTFWDRAGNSTTLEYDRTGSVAAMTLPGVVAEGSAVRPVLRFRSPAAAILPDSGRGGFTQPAPRKLPDEVWARVTEPRGDSATFVLDRWGAPTRARDSRGRESRVLRNALGQDTLTISPRGDTLHYSWEGSELRRTYRNGWRKNKLGATVWGPVWSINTEYEPVYHQPVHVYGNTTDAWYYYGSLGRLDSANVGYEMSPRSRFTYDTRGRLVSFKDPLGFETRYHRDGNPWLNTDSVVSPGARRVGMAYDGFGRDTLSRDPLNRTSRTQYDLLNRALRTIGPRQDTTSFTYDRLFLTGVRDAVGQTYGSEKNALGWDTAQVNPRAVRDRTTYDASGNVRSYTNRRNQTITFAYDARNRVTVRAAGADTTRYAYDAEDRWVEVRNAESIDTVFADTLGRVTRSVSVRAGQVHPLAYGYAEGDGLLTGITYQPPSGSGFPIGTMYRYNSTRQLSEIDFQGITYLDYDTRQMLSRIRYPTGDTLRLERTSLGEVSRVSHSKPTLELTFGRRYAFDRLGRITERRTAKFDTVRTITYDPLGQLQRVADEVDAVGDCRMEVHQGEVCTDTTRTVLAVEDFAWTKVGNPLHGAPMAETGNRLVRFRGYELAYDEDGNLTRKLRRNAAGAVEWEQVLEWDVLGQLRRVTTNGAAVEYGYDGVGQRVRRTDASGTVRYLYAGADLFAELDGAGVVRRAYSYFPGVDQPHAVQVDTALASQRYFYAAEAPGHVTGLFDGSNNVVGEYRYSAFGEAQVAQEGVPQPLRYMARELDAGTGLYQVRARWYDPVLERFVSEDPIGLAGGINAYAYAGNDPVNLTDPFGLCPPGHTWYGANIGGTMFWLRCPGAESPTGVSLPLPPRPGSYRGSGRCCRGQEEELFRMVARKTAWVYHSVEVIGEVGGLRDLADGTENLSNGRYVAGGVQLALAVPVLRPLRGARVVPVVRNAKLGNYIRDLYKGAHVRVPIGTGSTADAVRYERLIGQRVGGTFHTKKAQQYAAGLTNWLRDNPAADYYDRLVAQSVLDDLAAALRGW
jgi:RHS repeat-associated protein